MTNESSAGPDVQALSQKVGMPQQPLPQQLRPKPPRRSTGRWQKKLKVILTFVCLVGLSVAGVRHFKGSSDRAALPTADSRSGEFLTIVRCRGELRARRSAQIVAPANVPELRITWLAPAGEPISPGSPAVRFDPSSAEQQLTEKQAALDQAQATLDQAEADARITSAQDRLELSNSKYEVNRAELEVSKTEILSAMQAERSQIALDLAGERQSVQEATVRLHEASSRSKIAAMKRARDEAQAEVDLTEYRLSQMELKAPISGVIVFLQNRSQGWLNAQPFKVGDQVWRGASIAEIPDLETLEFEGKIAEIDRGSIHAGADVRVHIDALPELNLQAAVAAISPLTQPSFDFPPTRSFRGYAPLLQPDDRLRPGMLGSMDVIVGRIADAVIVPSQAVFTKEGKPVVYVHDGGGYRAVSIEIVGRNPDEYAVSGLQPDVTVALVEPEATT